jgi:hypothetical protein
MLDRIFVDDTVRGLRPDFAVLLMTAEGLVNAPSSGDVLHTGDLAESAAPHVEAWREAYRGFGVNPKRARPSVDALLRRAELPWIDRLTAAGAELAALLRAITPEVAIATRLVEP